MADGTGLSAETEAFELDDLERAAARLLHQWMARTIGELEGVASEDLAVAAERAGQASQVLEVIERVFEGIEYVRETLD